jgi:hypothetical protein
VQSTPSFCKASEAQRKQFIGLGYAGELQPEHITVRRSIDRRPSGIAKGSNSAAATADVDGSLEVVQSLGRN